MNTFLLTWNPSKWPFDNWLEALKDVADHGFNVQPWSCVSKKPREGDAVLLKKTGRGLTGLMGSGILLSGPYLKRHWRKGSEHRLKRFVQVRFERLTDYTKGEIMKVDDKVDFGFIPQASGCMLRADRAEDLLSRFLGFAAAPIVTPPAVSVPREKRRLAMSASLRYSILDRDAHTCRYCGRSSPRVELHIDHKISQCSWRERFGSWADAQVIDGVEYAGVNDPGNLVTSCSECNLGKNKKTGNPPSST